MELHHQFEVAVGVERAWAAFLDMPRIAPCMPGAEITEVIDERNVNGGAKVKVGPVNLRFAGRAEMTEVDETARSALMRAKGADAKGRGNAEADVRFSLAEPGPDRTSVDVNTALTLTGSVAQYGRASGLIDEIANQLIAQFVDNLEQELESSIEPESVPPSPAERRTEPEPEPPAARSETKAVSGLSLLLRAMWARIRKLLGRP